MNSVEQLEERIKGLEVKVEKLTQDVSKIIIDDEIKVVSKPQKQVSAKEFLLTYGAVTSIQKVFLLCFYLENHLGLSSFSVSDLEKAFRQAKEPLPKNLNDMINKNIAKGLLMESKELKDKKKTWVVTSSGESFIKGSFKN